MDQAPGSAKVYREGYGLSLWSDLSMGERSQRSRSVWGERAIPNGVAWALEIAVEVDRGVFGEAVTPENATWAAAEG